VRRDEICHCCPVGASAICSSPIRLKPSRQVGSEARVRFRKGRYEAGLNKMLGVLLNPELCIVVDSRIAPEQRSQSRRIDPSEGSSPRSVMASERDTTGILEQGMH